MFLLVVDDTMSGYFDTIEDAVQAGRQDARDNNAVFGSEQVTVDIYQLSRCDEFFFDEDGNITEQETIEH